MQFVRAGGVHHRLAGVGVGVGALIHLQIDLQQIEGHIDVVVVFRAVAGVAVVDDPVEAFGLVALLIDAGVARIDGERGQPCPEADGTHATRARGRADHARAHDHAGHLHHIHP